MIILKYNFVIGETYTRKDVKTIIGAEDPHLTTGQWTTGYASFDGCYFLFANINSPGRTGHNYKNNLVDNDLYWFSKKKQTLKTKTIKNFLSGKYEVYAFTRTDSKNPNFMFHGLGFVKDYEDVQPAHLVWGFSKSLSNIPNEYRSKKRISYIEGVRRKTMITKYERNPAARKKCIEHYGASCLVCDMNFEEKYGKIGKDFIHVHHEVEISSIGKEYEIDPITDLKPVCPNCHAMLHKRKPAYSIGELTILIKENN
ncbi:DUF3427 domain-containing protein [Enterococcus sp. BWM-S5]|uniref:DUF3427 domain-containing protein n=1 Tax=Enterococcus larvae TaxID=2794352 RepID=A0ABS4CMR6_9ENTE|nr:DUF3427 domain-containing protein [Enterococcus larvae]MBP1047562.1 DUF3427 domain-containing protein [Enterococcus larvae]